MDTRYDEYYNRLKNYSSLIEKQNKSIKVTAYFRLITFLIGLVITIYTFIIKSYIISAGVFIISAAVFVYLIIEHNKEVCRRNNLVALKEINERSLKRLNGEWKYFEDDGSEFKDKEHNYSDDLDIFGKSSLFQWINSSKTFMGRRALRERLTHPLKTYDDVGFTQESVKELAENVEWRQQFEAYGMVIKDLSTDPEELYKWGNDRNGEYNKPGFIFTARLLPCVTIIFILLACFTPYLDFKLPWIMILLQMMVLFIGSKKRNYVLNSVCKYKDNITLYLKLLKLIEGRDFKSDYLKQLKNKLTGDQDAVTSIKKLSDIYRGIADRQNAFFIIINILLLWDYRCVIEFEKWRIKCGNDLKIWFDVIGEFEALNSISNIVYDNPEWVMPSVADKKLILRGKELGHPLLGDERVCNDVVINKDRSILLITGSNMSGKSTFLRTVGINLVLSYIGAPVCAREFECSLMEIFTCMRISDNLENNISSFYAEILRIKKITQGVRENKKIFFLLDELFKGTNSIDRHEGAKALIKQLGRQGASGLISTHDLELSNLEQEYSRIKNYHFQEYYIDNKLKFDYKLRDGVSTTRNALYLIKLAGIDIE
ncbi:DNA repair protein [Clostridium fermenticellae]|uniref:DNA repair protein n=1 Tax=Clostridium fermenticellae TaxID=2068654 RepID=A0A386H3I4_9CLOT|nr:MutS family DNA mismatch repair protein [Clostridium fermenticellae]AYD40103.1 DNA repair protein [Clostridium fermenticellae]